MNEWLLRWLQMPRYGQWITVAGVPLVLLSLIGWFWLQPLRADRQRLVSEHQQLTLRFSTQMAQLRAQPRLNTLQSENHRLLVRLRSGAERAFSLLALVEYAGGLLEQWRPHPRGGEVVLLLNWPQLQRALDYLTSLQPPVTLQTFTIQRSGEQLRMAMSLGWQDEHEEK